MTQDADHDPEFEAFLRRRSPMHRRLSQIDHAEPSADLDRIVLDRARDAIGAPAQEPMYRKPRWAMPLGLAATILIAFTVVLNIDHRRSFGQQGSNATARLAETPAIASASDASARERRQFEAQKREAAPAAPAIATPAEQPALASRGFVESREEAESDEAPFPEAESAADIAVRRDDSLASSRSVLSSPSAVAKGVGAATPATQAAPPPASAPVADFHASPESWLAEIERLRAAGKTEEADREMAAFRRAHPAHPGYSLAQPPTR